MSSVVFGFCVLHYLWGIDTCQLSCKHSTTNTFYITYEELTRTKQINFSSYKSFYITYEELTHTISFNNSIASSSFFTRFTLPMRNWHVSGKPQNFLHITTCFTLPMRNWHHITWFIMLDVPFSVLHYLWGIDTSATFMFLFIILCFTLPMRNWHESLSNWMFIEHASCMFYITYEELTH